MTSPLFSNAPAVPAPELGMSAAVHAVDWSSTPLGPMQAWPQGLRTVVRLLLDSRYAMWLAWGPELTFFCNDAYRPTLGEKKAFIGAPASRVWAEIWPDIGPRIDHVLSTAQATWDEGLLLFLERMGFKEETYHTFSYSPVHGDTGTVEGMLCVVTEDTQRVLGERRLSTLAALSGGLLTEHSTTAACDAAVRSLALNDRDVPFALLYLIDERNGSTRLAAAGGFSAEQLLTIGGLHARSPEQWALHEVGASNVARVVDALPGVLPAQCGPWPEQVQSAVILPLARHGQDEHKAGYLIVGVSPRLQLDDAYLRFLDLVAAQVSSSIADAKAFEDERKRAEKLAELDRAKTTFFSNVSHELRTPLTLILSPLDELVASEPDGARRDLLALARRNGQRLQRLVNSLLEFARIEAGRIQASFEATDLAAMTRDLTSTFRSAIEQAGLSLHVDCSLAEPVFVDREMWEKVVLNLLSNAFKFTLTGTITVQLHRQGQHAVLKVSDTGVGIDPAEMPRLFERFHRIEGMAGRTQEGSGIGLALVQELVKLHGGTIHASSQIAVGTTFHLSLPLGNAHLPHERVKQPRSLAAPTVSAQAFAIEAQSWIADTPANPAAHAPLLGAHEPTSADRRFADTFGARIILADDNADMRTYVRNLLSPAYQVEVVNDGAMALEAARRDRPDLIVTDVMMPHLDGFGLLRAVRSDPALLGTPVIMLSARAGEEARIEGLDSGVDDYLVKPFSARELLARVGAILERAQQLKERERIHASLQLRTAQFETLLREAPLGVYLVDADLRITEANPTARQVFGDIPDLIGRDFVEVVHVLWPQAYAQEIVQQFRDTLATGKPYVTLERIEARQDRVAPQYYEWQINRTPFPDGRHGVVCYLRDISIHVQARRRLEAADRQKDEFLAMLAHELRNPLAPIRNVGELLSRLVHGDSRVDLAISILQRQTGLLTRLVDDLLDVSRITQGRIELQLEPVQLAEVIAQAIETVEPLVKERNHQLVVTSSGTLRLNGDPARLVQCIVNVLTNAAKYTDTGGRIGLQTSQDGDEAVLIITDNGTGIPAELLPFVFDLFVQSNRTLDRSQGGLGIGLSLVKRLIEMHGGRVWARSDGTDQGTTIEIRLPLAQEPHKLAQEASRTTLQPLRILVVDDNRDVATSLVAILQIEGHEAESVYTATSALERLPSFQPDVMLLDIGLPEMNGYEVARRIRSKAEHKKLNLVALTGYGQAEDRERSEAAGFDDHLVKPVDYAVLMSCLARLQGRVETESP